MSAFFVYILQSAVCLAILFLFYSILLRSAAAKQQDKTANTGKCCKLVLHLYPTFHSYRYSIHRLVCRHNTLNTFLRDRKYTF